MRLLAVAVIGCAPPAILPLPKAWDDGSVVVAAHVGESGEPISAVALAPDVAAVGLPASIGDRVVAFAVRPGGFVDESGRAVDAPRFLGLEVEVGPPTAGCGRCSADPAVGPQVVHEGDGCPPPRFASTSAFQVEEDGLQPIEIAAEQIELIRRSITLQWPGPCACVPPVLSAPAEPSLQVLSPIDSLPIDAVVQSPEGGVILLGEHLLARVDASGERTDREPPFEGRVLAAVGLPGDRFFVASHAPYALRDTRYDLFDAALGTVFSSRDQLVHRPERIHFFDDIGVTVLAGRGAPQTASLMVCAIDAGVTCRDLLTSSLAEPWMVDATRTGSGMLVGLGTLGRLVVFEVVPSPAGGSVRSRELPPIAPGITFTSALSSIQDRLFACASTDQQVILTATIGPSILESAAPPIWRTAHCGPTRCTHLVATSSGTMRAELDGGLIVELGADGEPLLGRGEGCDDPARAYDGPAIGRPLRERHLLSDRTEAIVGVDDAVVLRDLRAGSVSRIHGSDPPISGHAGAIVSAGGAFYVLPAYGAMLPIEGATDVRSLSLAIGGDEIPTGAVVDVTRDAILAVGTCKLGCTSWARFITFDGRVEEVALPADLTDRLSAVATAAPDTHVAVGAQSIIVIRDGVATQAVIDWRGEPPACTAGMVVSSAQGLAYVGACKGTVLRVIPFGDPPHAERLDLLEVDPILFDPLLHATPPITAIRSFCADDLLFGASASGGDAEEEAGWIWELRAGALEAYRGNASAALARRQSGAPIAFVGAPDRPAVVSSNTPARYGSVHRFGSRSRLFFGAAFTAAAASDAGAILIGASYGRLLLVE